MPPRALPAVSQWDTKARRGPRKRARWFRKISIASTFRSIHIKRCNGDLIDDGAEQPVAGLRAEGPLLDLIRVGVRRCRPAAVPCDVDGLEPSDEAWTTNTTAETPGLSVVHCDVHGPR